MGDTLLETPSSLCVPRCGMASKPSLHLLLVPRSRSIMPMQLVPHKAVMNAFVDLWLPGLNIMTGPLRV